jgi:hypothetical protein
MKNPYPMASSFDSRTGADPPAQTPEHDAGEEGAEHRVEVEAIGHGDQRYQQQHRPTQGDLGGLVLADRDDRRQPAARPHPTPGHPQSHRKDGDAAERGQCGEPVLRAEEHRDAQDRKELSDRTRGQQVEPEAAVQQIPLPQHGQQRPECGRRQPECHRHERADQPGGCQQGHHAEGEGERDEPRSDRPPARVLAEQPQVDLVAGQQEHEPEPDVGEDLHVAGRAETEHLGADHHPADEQQHDLRDQQPRQQPEGQRRQQGHGGDSHEGVDPDDSVHAAPRPPALISRSRPAWLASLPISCGPVQGRSSPWCIDREC